MSVSTANADNQKAIELTREAHAAELDGKYKQAYDLQGQAASLLVKVVAGMQKKSEERRRAKLQLRAANDRQMALRACAHGTGNAPNPLPSLVTAQREWANPAPGTVLLTLVEMGDCATLNDTPGIREQQQPKDVLNPPLLTPLLSPSLPNVTYHVYTEVLSRFPDSQWVYYHIRDAAKTQTLYTLSARKQNRYQIPVCTMARTAEYHSTCATVTVTSIRPRDLRSTAGRVGRPLDILPGTQKVVRDAPDRLERDGWTPSRFTYGGRRFVWKEGAGGVLKNFVESLYEVESEKPNPQSKTGKIMDKTPGRPLMWGETKTALYKECTIHMVGGLDQMFRELLLASQVTRLLIRSHGHY